MKLTRFAPLAAALVAGSLSLAACGSDNNGSDAARTSGTSSDLPVAHCQPGTLQGEGSSAQKNAIEEAIANYIASCGDATINYSPTGSGAGVKQFAAGQVDFAGSDSALKADKGEVDAANRRCAGNEAWNLPMAVGPIALAYHLPGVDHLVLDAETAAKIFSGAIRTWNDPAIAALNEGTTLPSDDIKVFYRSDESGTTENVTRYLAAAAPKAWTHEPAKSWSGAGEGREKSSGVADGVKATANSITYVEWSYAKDNQLGVAQIDNGSGPVALTADAVSKAVAVAKPDGEGNDLRLSLQYNTKEPGAYPVTLVTYEIVCSKGLDAEKTALLKSFLSYYSDTQTQRSLVDIGYAPLPDALRAKVQSAVAAIS